VVVDVGLVEEFFFRVLLQSRLATLFKSETAGIVLASLLFGIALEPGLYLHPAATQEAVGFAPSLVMAITYSLALPPSRDSFFRCAMVQDEKHANHQSRPSGRGKVGTPKTKKSKEVVPMPEPLVFRLQTYLQIMDKRGAVLWVRQRLHIGNEPLNIRERR